MAAALQLAELATCVDFVALLRKAAIRRRSALAVDGVRIYAANSTGFPAVGTGRLEILAASVPFALVGAI